jgi:hypothetical protein
MHPVLITSLCVLAAIYLTGLIVGIVGILRAPQGFEDDSGFHYGERPFGRSAERPTERRPERDDADSHSWSFPGAHA